MAYTPIGLKLRIWTAPKPRDSTIANGSILEIWTRLRSLNRGSFRVGPNRSFRPMGVYQHLIFYDGQCGLCDRCVQMVLRADKRQIFAFAPLQGQTAEKMLQGIPRDLDSVILIEDYLTAHRKIYVRSTAVFRTCWLLGGGYRLIGWKFFLPAWLFDWGYRIVAKNRHRLGVCPAVRPDAGHGDRFLP